MGSKAFGGRRVGRTEVPALVDSLLADLCLAEIPHQIAGSFRRCLPDCTEIDLVLIPKDAQRLQVKDAIKRAFGRLKAKDEPRLSGIYEGALFDLHVVDLDRLGSMMLHATGSWQFNKLMRSRAMAKGWKLNKFGLFEPHSGESVLQSSDEAAFFAVLEMPYIETEDRSQGHEFGLKSLTDPDRMCKYRLVEDGWKIVG